MRVHDGHSADLLGIGVNACRWFTRLIPMSHELQIFRDGAQTEGFHWVVYPTRWRCCGETSSFAEPCCHLLGNKAMSPDIECPEFD
jgi:hypothetical protein